MVEEHQPNVSAGAQESLVRAMMEPGFYPKPPPAVTHQETHISHVFFVGELVYKIKKPVKYSFLDFTALNRRRYYLNEELRLNRRLAPSVYIGVMPISFDASQWRLGGWGEPAEYTLVMRRLPAKRMLPFLLETDQVAPEMMEQLAELLVNFHNTAKPVFGLDGQRYFAAVMGQWQENLAEIEPLLGQLFDLEGYQLMRAYGDDFLRRHAARFRARAERGWVRDVHGDLHCEHICFAPEGIQVFDCIEFSSRLRRCDLASEVGFLLMDLEFRGGEVWAEQFLAAYRKRIGDRNLTSLLPFAKCYRALVRAKVHALRGEVGHDMARRYLRYAERLAWREMKPFVVLVSGLTGSGKSTLTKALSENTGLRAVNSDVVRKALAPKLRRGVEPLHEGLYSARMTQKTYNRLAREAEQELGASAGLIVDATFTQREQRAKLIKAARKHGAEIFVIRCTATESAIRQRLDRRQLAGMSISDGRWEVYLAQKSIDQPALDSEIDHSHRLEVDTEMPLDQQLRACKKWLLANLNPYSVTTEQPACVTVC